MRTKLIYALIMTMFLVVSCGESGDELKPTPNRPITIPAEFTDLSLEDSALSREVKFTATTNWEVTLEETTKAVPSWLKVSPMSGKAGSVTLKVKVEKNTLEKERSSIVKINAGGEKYTITVKQKAGKPEVVAVTGVALNKSTLSFVEGEGETLVATVNPENATNKNITWKSSDDTIATVADGKVTAIKAGTATIAVTTEDGAKTATCEVTVRAKVVAVTGVALNKSTLSFVEGEGESLVATVNPENATNKNVTWKSSDDTIATVADGKVTAIKAGVATITVTTEDGAKTATCEVKVQAKIVAVTSVTINKSTLSLAEGKSETLVATVNPSNATNKNITWKSSDEKVATVADGKVTAIKAGVATITVTTEDGAKTATCEVKVQYDSETVTPPAITGGEL